LNDSDEEIRSTIDGRMMFESFSLSGFSKKQKEDMDMLSSDDEEVHGPEATDEVVERLKKEKDELEDRLRKEKDELEDRYKALLLIETERSEKRRRKLVKYYNLHVEQKVRKIFI
jgi:hypothetical protein